MNSEKHIIYGYCEDNPFSICSWDSEVIFGLKVSDLDVRVLTASGNVRQREGFIGAFTALVSLSLECKKELNKAQSEATSLAARKKLSQSLTEKFSCNGSFFYFSDLGGNEAKKNKSAKKEKKRPYHSLVKSLVFLVIILCAGSNWTHKNNTKLHQKLAIPIPAQRFINHT